MDVYLTHSRRTCHLLVHKLHQMVFRNSIESSFGHPSGWTRYQLCWRCPKRKIIRIAIKSQAIAWPSRTNHQGAKLPTSKSFFLVKVKWWFVCDLTNFFSLLVSRRKVQTNQWKHQLQGVMVVPRPNLYSPCHGCMANETSEELFRSQKASVTDNSCVSHPFLLRCCDFFFLNFQHSIKMRTRRVTEEVLLNKTSEWLADS